MRDTLIYTFPAKLNAYLIARIAETARELASTGDCGEFGDNRPDELAYIVNEDYGPEFFAHLDRLAVAGARFPRPLNATIATPWADYEEFAERRYAATPATLTFDLEFLSEDESDRFRETFPTPESLFDGLRVVPSFALTFADGGATEYPTHLSALKAFDAACKAGVATTVVTYRYANGQCIAKTGPRMHAGQIIS